MIYLILSFIIVFISLICLNLSSVLKYYYFKEKHKYEFKPASVNVINYNYENLKPIFLNLKYVMPEEYFRFRKMNVDERYIIERTKDILFEKIIQELREDFNTNFFKSEIFDIREMKNYEFNKTHKDQLGFNVTLTILPRHKF